jgi:hypothetical protein
LQPKVAPNSKSNNLIQKAQGDTEGISLGERSLDAKLRTLEGEKQNDMGKEILISKHSGVGKHSFMLR